MRDQSSLKSRRERALAVVGGFVLMLGGVRPAVAQSSVTSTNNGALHFTGGLDVPSVYVFRGIVQEVEPKITLWPYGDLAIALGSGEGILRSCAVNVGVWHSLQTGSSGTNGPSRHAHYEEDFYTTLNLGFGGGLGVGLTYMALTSPNNMFNTVKEFQIKIAKSQLLNPYGFAAVELTRDGQADLGARKGAYLELGIGPSWSIARRATLTVPAKLGLSLKDYYEHPLTGEDSKFGWFDVGGLITIPLGGIPSRYGLWNVHGGADVLFFGDSTEAFNIDSDGATSQHKVVGQLGVGVTY